MLLLNLLTVSSFVMASGEGDRADRIRALEAQLKGMDVTTCPVSVPPGAAACVAVVPEQGGGGAAAAVAVGDGERVQMTAELRTCNEGLVRVQAELRTLGEQHRALKARHLELTNERAKKVAERGKITLPTDAKKQGGPLKKITELEAQIEQLRQDLLRCQEEIRANDGERVCQAQEASALEARIGELSVTLGLRGTAPRPSDAYESLEVRVGMYNVPLIPVMGDEVARLSSDLADVQDQIHGKPEGAHARLRAAKGLFGLMVKDKEAAEQARADLLRLREVRADLERRYAEALTAARSTLADTRDALSTDKGTLREDRRRTQERERELRAADKKMARVIARLERRGKRSRGASSDVSSVASDLARMSDFETEAPTSGVQAMEGGDS